MNVTLKPAVLRWARQRAGFDSARLAQKVGTQPETVELWEQTGELRYKQAERLAHVTHTPFGFMFLETPPEDRLPIPDFRTLGNEMPRHPSPDLLETIQLMQRRQDWMREFLIEEKESPLSFIQSASLHEPHEEVARRMRETLGFSQNWAAQERNWTEALLRMRRAIESVEILIFINGVVGNNGHRRLDPHEFRGFALADPYAPLIFINGADGKAAQMFTIAHELAHLWLGLDGVSNLDDRQISLNQSEVFCNKVAAEFLVPAESIQVAWNQARRFENPYQYLARRFKVSEIVVARRVLDLELIDRTAFFRFYEGYEQAIGQKPRSSGGSFWNNQMVRVGQRFGSAVVRAANEGRLLYRDAYQLTGLSGPTFQEFARQLRGNF